MKYLKLALISFLFFFVLLTFIGLLFPSRINVVKAVVVNKERKEVLVKLNALGTWTQWHPYFDGVSAGAVDSIDDAHFIFSNGRTKLELVNRKTDSAGLSFTLQTSGFESSEQLLALPVNSSDYQTQVVWRETQHLKWYPWERFRGLLLERSNGDYLDSALNRFKNYAESGK